MKPVIKKLLLLVLVALPAVVQAQTFTLLHTFAGNDGANPYGGLLLNGNTLYGTAAAGGTNGTGAIFKLNTDGTGYTNLYSFAAGHPINLMMFTNSDGGSPQASLIISGNTLYGTAAGGGHYGLGSIFSLSTDGTGFTNRYTFAGGTDGGSPQASLILSDNILYGTATSGGRGGGTIFALGTAGNNFTNLHIFATDGSEGITPYCSLVLLGSTLYGTTFDGQTAGSVFSVGTNGAGFINLPSASGHHAAGLILSGNTFYGTTIGSVFKIDMDGTGFTNLCSVSANYSGLVLSGNNLYGTTINGGSSSKGSLFTVHTDGTGFTNLYSFTGGNDGSTPYATLILSGNMLYGAAQLGGTNGLGTIFRLALPAAPQLKIADAGTNVVLMWPTNAITFNLQSTTNLIPPVAWSAVSPQPVIVNGVNTVTNPLAGNQQFYRLSQ